MKLLEVCNLRGGFQGKMVEEGNKYKLIKLKDVNSDGEINYNELNFFTPDNELNEKYRLKKGDVIFKAKSGDNTAAIIDGSEENIVATYHYIILTVKNKDLLDPEYLEAYLNSKYAKEYFDRNSEGIILSIIKLKALEEMEIKIIDIEKQRNIAKVYNLIKEEKRIMKKMIELREDQYKVYIKNFIE